MGKVASLAGMLLSVASGCSSASSSSGTLAPAQLDTDDPNVSRPPTGITKSPPPPPPEDMGLSPGCPSSREPASTSLVDADDVRARLVGIYRSCLGDNALEVRIDPYTETRLLWYALDDRFVRIEGGTTTLGSIDIVQCDGASCSVTWESDRAGDYDQDRTLTVWTEPTAFVVATGNGASWGEWVRVAK